MDKKSRENIILIGFMGSGKTSIGKDLAEQLLYTFCDTDQMIEEKAQTTIKEMFRMQGEEYFRTYETNLLLELKYNLHDTVLSTGGGLPIREQNSKLLKEIGQVIYLKAEKETIIKRLIGDTSRPLIQGEDMDQKIGQLLVERSPLYEKAADLIITTDGKSVNEIISEVLKKLEKD